MPENSVFDFSVPGSSTINVTAPGQILKISLKGFPESFLQPPFTVMTERVDPVAHVISVVTLAGHPLAGWRYWRVYSIGTNDVVIETGAYDQPAPGIANYAGYYIARGAQLKGWEDFLNHIRFNLGAPQGTNLRSSLGGILLRAYPPQAGLLHGRWDYSGDFTQYILNNVCQSTACQ